MSLKPHQKSKVNQLKYRFDKAINKRLREVRTLKKNKADRLRVLTNKLNRINKKRG